MGRQARATAAGACIGGGRRSKASGLRYVDDFKPVFKWMPITATRSKSQNFKKTNSGGKKMTRKSLRDVLSDRSGGENFQKLWNSTEAAGDLTPVPNSSLPGKSYK